MLNTDAPIAVLSSRESIGDCFMKLPLLRALRQSYPGRDVSWIVSEGGSPFASVLSQMARPLVASVIEEARIERPVRAAIARLRRLPPYSLVIDTRSNVNRVLLARAMLRYEIFLAPTPGYLLSQRRPGLFRRQTHRGGRLLELLAAVTGQREDVGDEIDLPADLVATAAELLPAGPVYVGLGPGASNVYKCWPLDRFVALAHRLREQGRAPVFLIGPNERELVPQLRRALPCALYPGCDLRDGHLARAELTLALGRRLAAAVVNDTGVGHLLAAAGVPLVSLFGPTDPRRWAPHGSRVRLVRAQQFGERWMAAIPLDAVASALDELLAEGARGDARRMLA